MSADSYRGDARSGGFRPDVRAATEAAAAAEFNLNGTCLALVAVEIVNELANWSEPVQMRCVRGKDGLVEFEIRSYSRV